MGRWQVGINLSNLYQTAPLKKENKVLRSLVVTWSSASFDSVHKTLTPNAPGILSPNKVKTRYTSLDGKITIIKDNENN